MKKEKVKALRDDLIEKTGIDFEKYRSDELSDRIGSIITFPIYFWGTTLKPVIIYLLIVLALSIMFFWHGNSVMIAAFSLIIGIMLGSFDGVLQGLINFLKRLEEDISGILNLCLEIARNVLVDIRNATSNRIQNLPKVSEIISGVILIVIVPTLNRIIRDKIPLVGGPIVGLIDLILDKLTAIVPTISDNISEAKIVDKIEAKKEKMSGEIEQKSSEYFEVSSSIIDKVSQTSDSTIKTVLNKVALPFRYVLRIGYAITLIVYLLLCRAVF